MTKYGIKRACIAIAVLFAVNIAVITLAQRADAASYKRGSTGSVVSEIQQKLKDWGYYSADVDGVYGSRTEAAVLYELNHNLSNGHVFLPKDKLLNATCQLLGCGMEQVETALDALAELGRERQILLFTCQEREGNYLEGRPGVTRTALRGGGA